MGKRIREPKLVRARKDDVSGTRVVIVLSALLLIGGLMYFNKDRAKAVADRPNATSMNQSSTTGSAPSR